MSGRVGALGYRLIARQHQSDGYSNRLPTGFLLAKEMQDRADARLLTAYGTLYKALARLEKTGFLDSFWEDPQVAADEGRPRRRFYRVMTRCSTSILGRSSRITPASSSWPPADSSAIATSAW